MTPCWRITVWGLALGVALAGAFAAHEKRPSKPPRNMFIELSVERGRRTRGASYSTKNQTVKLQVTLTNRNTTQDFRDLTGYSYVVAQDVQDKKRFKLIIKETAAFSLLRGEKTQHETSDIRLDFYTHQSYGHGFKYYGYVYLVEDQAGQVLVGEAMPELLWQKLGRLADLELDEEFEL